MFTYGAAFTPEDNYASIRFGMAEAVNSGITAVHAWEHNIQTPQHARGLAASAAGVRDARTIRMGPPDAESPRSFALRTETIDFEDILRFRDEEFSTPGRFDLGIAARASSSLGRRCGRRSPRSPAGTAYRSRPFPRWLHPWPAAGSRFPPPTPPQRGCGHDPTDRAHLSLPFVLPFRPPVTSATTRARPN